MRPTTIVWMGIRHVGDAKWVVTPRELPAGEVPREFARVMLQVSLAKRLELVIARSEGEVLDRLTSSARGANGSSSSLGGFEFDMDELEREMADAASGQVV